MYLTKAIGKVCELLNIIGQQLISYTVEAAFSPHAKHSSQEGMFPRTYRALIVSRFSTELAKVFVPGLEERGSVAVIHGFDERVECCRPPNMLTGLCPPLLLLSRTR